jgi:serine/threonine protein kinase
VTSNLYGPLHQPFPLAAAYDSTQTNILIDRDFHPRLTDYGLVTTILDPDTVYSNVVFPYAIQCVAPELLNPPGFGLKDSTPTKKSDVYGFGMVMYQVSNTYFISGTANKCSIQVITEQKPFSGTRAGAIICKIVTGERPGRPPGPNEWLSDNVWDFISRCWSPSLDGRPNVKFVMNALNDAADAVDIRHGKLRTTTNGQGKQTSRQVPGASRRSYHKQTLTFVINSILEDSRDSVSIHYQNTPRLQGDEEGTKKYPLPLTLLPVLTPLLQKCTSERGMIPPVLTGTMQHLWTSRPESSTFACLMARYWKYRRTNCLQRT